MSHYSWPFGLFYLFKEVVYRLWRESGSRETLEEKWIIVSSFELEKWIFMSRFHLDFQDFERKNYSFSSRSPWFFILKVSFPFEFQDLEKENNVSPLKIWDLVSCLTSCTSLAFPSVYVFSYVPSKHLHYKMHSHNDCIVWLFSTVCSCIRGCKVNWLHSFDFSPTMCF